MIAFVFALLSAFAPVQTERDHENLFNYIELNLLSTPVDSAGEFCLIGLLANKEPLVDRYLANCSDFERSLIVSFLISELAASRFVIKIRIIKIVVSFFS